MKWVNHLPSALRSSSKFSLLFIFQVPVKLGISTCSFLSLWLLKTCLLIQKPSIRSKKLSLSHPVSSRVSPSLSFCLCVTPSGPLHSKHLWRTSVVPPSHPDGCDGLQEHPFSNASYSSHTLEFIALILSGLSHLFSYKAPKDFK